MTNLGRTKPRGPGIVYGERAPTVVAAVKMEADRRFDCDALWKHFAENAVAQAV